jgi:hypothetical protein
MSNNEFDQYAINYYSYETREIDDGYETDDTIKTPIYQYRHSRYGEIVVNIKDLPERETLFEGNEYIYNEEKIRIIELLLNRDGESNKYGRLDLTFEPFLIYTNEEDIEDFTMDICEFAKLIHNGDIEITKSMHEEYIKIYDDVINATII